MPLVANLSGISSTQSYGKRQLDRGVLILGRATDCDWVLTDPTRRLSNHHCVIIYRDGAYHITDTSTNGTTLNDAPEPLGKGRSAVIGDGDRITIGPYAVHFTIEPDLPEEPTPENDPEASTKLQPITKLIEAVGTASATDAPELPAASKEVAAGIKGLLRQINPFAGGDAAAAAARWSCSLTAVSETEDAVVHDAVVPPEDVFTIGRGADCDLVLPDPDNILSRRHCTIELTADGYYITDTSRNGVALNQTASRLGKGSNAKLSNGDRICLGRMTLLVAITAPAQLESTDADPDPPAQGVRSPARAKPGSPLDEGRSDQASRVAERLPVRRVVAELTKSRFADWTSRLRPPAHIRGQTEMATAVVRSPQEIHRVLPVLDRSSRVIQVSLLLALGAAVAYAVFGSIPVTVQGKAMILSPGSIVPFQAPATGQIGEWRVEPGDDVAVGDLLAIIEQPALEKSLLQERQTLADTEQRNRGQSELESNYVRLQLESVERKRSMLVERIAELTEHVERSRSLAITQQGQRERQLVSKLSDLQNVSALTGTRVAELTAKLGQTQKLFDQGIIAEDALLQAIEAYNAELGQRAELDVQLLQVQLQKTRATVSYMNTLGAIAERQDTVVDLNQELEQLANQLAKIEHENAVADYDRQLQESELVRRISRFEQQLAAEKEIRSEHQGRIIELAATEGNLVARGTRLGSIDTSTASSELDAIAYFNVAQGKQIKPGMSLRLIPASVERQRYGSLQARVKSVSSFPVTLEGASTSLGSRRVAQALTSEGALIEVVAKLLRREVDERAYVWDLSDGPEIAISSGTTAQALVNVKQKPPLTFVVPILGDWTGFQ